MEYSRHGRRVAAMNNQMADICHDVTFLVGENKMEISCHKIFLAILSPVFEAMFSQRHAPTNGLTLECKAVSNAQNSKSQSHTIIIPDMEPDVLKGIIKYAYTGIFNVDLHDIYHTFNTLYACHKYNITELYKHCSQVIQTKLSLENVVSIYTAALHFTDENLEKKSWEFIEANATALLDSDQFLEFSGENLPKFLSLDSMPGLRSEVDVLKALTRWGKFKCHQRDINATEENVKSVLEPYLPLIRFPTMEVNEFIEEVQNCGVLSLIECNKLLNYFILSGEKRVAVADTLKYSFERREFRKVVFCCRAINATFGSTLAYDYDHLDCFFVTGDAETTIKLKSVGIVLPLSTGSGIQNVSICLHDGTVKDWKRSATGTLSKSLEISYIEFDRPVILKFNTVYDLVVNCQWDCFPHQWVKLVKYSQKLLKQSKFTWSTGNNKQIELDFTPSSCVIWALEFEN